MTMIQEWAAAVARQAMSAVGSPRQSLAGCFAADLLFGSAQGGSVEGVVDGERRDVEAVGDEILRPVLGCDELLLGPAEDLKPVDS